MGNGIDMLIITHLVFPCRQNEIKQVHVLNRAHSY